MINKINYFFFAIALISSSFLFSCNNSSDDENSSADTLVKEVVVPREYGFAIDTFNIQKFAVEEGDNLSFMLEKLGFSANVRHAISLKANGVIDVKKISLGAPYALVQIKPQFAAKGDTAKFFVYEPNPRSYAVFRVGDSITSYFVERKLIVLEMKASGLIESSLWNAMESAKLDPVLALKMSDVFAWSIDFFGLQKGDKFKLIYEQTTVEDNDLWYRLGDIKAAVFHHMDSVYYAIPFTTPTDTGYYDQNGKSLKTAFLKAPLNYSRISSEFTNSRLHPILKIYRAHHGVDYSAPTGTPVHSVANGVVTVAGYGSGAGNWVKIKHDQNYETAYMHLSRFADGIKVGTRVSQGQLIGYVGSTGLSTGPHLDFRFWKNGEPIDPLKVVGPPALPVPDSLMPKFIEVRNQNMKMLEEIAFPTPSQTIDNDEVDSDAIENFEH